jgi:hypothetical protein
MTEPVLYRWPATAAFGRTVPKTKFYEHGNVRAALREKFVNDVQRITWSYKLAENTIHLRGSAAVPEIQVFTIEAKSNDVSDDVLAAIDKSVQFPIVFEVATPARVRVVAAQKTLGAAALKVRTYFTTEWAPADAVRRPLPSAIDLPTLYEAILISLLPVPARVGETLSDAADRINGARKLQREITALEKKLRTEPQFNRKIEIRRRLQDCEVALIKLTETELHNRG